MDRGAELAFALIAAGIDFGAERGGLAAGGLVDMVVVLGRVDGFLTEDRVAIFAGFVAVLTEDLVAIFAGFVAVLTGLVTVLADGLAVPAAAGFPGAARPFTIVAARPFAIVAAFGLAMIFFGAAGIVFFGVTGIAFRWGSVEVLSPDRGGGS